MIKNSISFLIFILLSSCALFSNSKLAVTSFPTYGNHCGLTAKVTKMPINMTDFSCREHNLCYEKKQHSKKTCDKRLISGLKRVYPQSKAEESAQKLIVSYFEFIKR